MSHNPSITDPNMISVGQAICVPGIGGVENLQHSGPPSREEMVQHYIDVARRDALEYGLNSDYFVRQIQLESGFQPDQVSPKGAIGIAQLMPSTAATYHIDPRDPDKSLDVAAQIMESYLKEYNWDNAKALAAYNAGDGAVQNAITQYGDSWQLGLPWETQQYIKNVMYP